MKSAPTGFSVDFRDVGDPERTYYGEECWVEMDRGIVGIFFAQKNKAGQGLRSLVGIRMAPLFIVSWLKSVDAIQSPSISDIANGVGAKPERLTQFKEEPAQTFEISANVVKTGMSGHDVTLDFIKVTPFGIIEARGGKAKGEPKLRVETRSSLFLGLMETLKEMSKSFPKDAHGVSVSEKHV